MFQEIPSNKRTLAGSQGMRTGTTPRKTIPHGFLSGNSIPVHSQRRSFPENQQLKGTTWVCRSKASWDELSEALVAQRIELALQAASALPVAHGAGRGKTWGNAAPER